MDTEEEINNAAEKIMRDITVSKLDALNMLLGRYQSQKRLEEAVIVQKVIEKEKSKPEDYGHGLRQDM
jgi:VIT1/CCC1 family predicted Fe2+/Mn2+ transporter